MADVRDGLGPYLSVFLKGSQHWQPGPIGVAMAASSVAAAAFQIPAGLLVDSLKAKRLLVAASGLGVAVGCLLIAFYPKFAGVTAAQLVMIGVAWAVGRAMAGGVGRKPIFLVALAVLPVRGTGRFNLAQGLVALAIGIDAGLSNVVAGYIVQAFGYPAGFLSLAGLALGALAFFALLMPKTAQGEPTPA